MGRAVEHMSTCTNRKKPHVLPSPRCLSLFVTSIARTNLEAAIIERGGSLCSNNLVRYKPKKDNIIGKNKINC